VKRVLALGAHPDDVETGCAGTLLKHLAAGDEVVVVVGTTGGYGDRPWPLIEAEMRAAQAVLGCEYVVLDNPVGHYDVSWKTVTELDAILQERRIDTLYGHWYGDSHQDHQAAFRNLLAAARKKEARSLYCYELPDYSYRSQHTFAAKRFVDVTDHIEGKLEAMAAYGSYIGPHHLEAARGQALHRGLACGHLRAAEAFEVIFETVLEL
jgi:LmbE family N-acetylglucosaminyl deacetylase